MDLADFLRSAGRRWYVLVAGVLLTAVIALITFSVVPVSYDIKASVLLLPPRITVEEVGGNPFLNLGGLDVAAGVLAKSITDSPSVELVVPPGSKAEYTVQLDASVSGSVLEIAVADATPEAALKTLLSIQELASERLDELQTAVAPSGLNQVELMVVTNNTVAEPNYSTLIRALIVAIAIGLVFTLLSAIAVDSLVRRHKVRAEERRRDAVERGDDDLELDMPSYETAETTTGAATAATTVAATADEARSATLVSKD